MTARASCVPVRAWTLNWALAREGCSSGRKGARGVPVFVAAARRWHSCLAPATAALGRVGRRRHQRQQQQQGHRQRPQIPSGRAKATPACRPPPGPRHWTHDHGPAWDGSARSPRSMHRTLPHWCVVELRPMMRMGCCTATACARLPCLPIFFGLAMIRPGRGGALLRRVAAVRPVRPKRLNAGLGANWPISLWSP